MTPSLDVHVAMIPSVPESWIRECVESINAAVKQCDYDIKIHLFDGVIDHIGNTRKIGYDKGDYQYCTNIDCDDYILPNAFSILKESLSNNVALISTGEIQLQNGNYVKMVESKFHLKIYRRDLLQNINYDLHPLDIDVIINKTIRQHHDGVINIPECVYVHRLYWNSGSRILSRKINKMKNNNG